MFESLKIYVGLKIDPYIIIKKLDSYGYKKTEHIAEEADYAHRGGILDIFIVGFDDPVRIEFICDKICSIRSFDVIYGDFTGSHNIVILLPIKGITPRRLKSKLLEYGEEVPINNFVDIEPGDFVVHVEYGIGSYLGIEKIKLEKKYIDHIAIEYAGNDRLLLPMDEMHLIQKYIGFEGAPPRLYKL